MKRPDLLLAALLVPLDALALLFAGMTAYTLRFHPFFTEIRPVIFALTFPDYLRLTMPIIAGWIGVFAITGLYAVRPLKFSREFLRLFLACATGMALLFSFLFFSRSLFDSRFIVLAAWVLAILFVTGERIGVRILRRILLALGIGNRRVTLIGKGRTAEALIEAFHQQPSLGYHVVTCLDLMGEETKKRLRHLKECGETDTVVLADPDLSREQIVDLIAFTEAEHLDFFYAADLFTTALGRTEFSTIAGIPILEIKKTPLDGWGAIYKRSFDLGVSLLLLIFLSPVLLLTAAAIKLDSRGPIFYLDYRTGRHGRRFLFYKFRSMDARLCDGEGPSASREGNQMLRKLETEKNHKQGKVLHKIKDDPRITRVGRFLRRWSVDELPQLFNVLKDDISLVGPRAHMTLETARYESGHKKVLTIKPGITGLAQISGRSDLAFEEEMRLDTSYIEHWNPWLDF